MGKLPPGLAAWKARQRAAGPMPKKGATEERGEGKQPASEEKDGAREGRVHQSAKTHK